MSEGDVDETQREGPAARARAQLGASASPVPGEQLDRFVILDVLGTGGMGVVYSAYDPRLDRRVAIKLLRVDADSGNAEVRLLREAQAMAKIDHPNVIKVHEVGTHAGQVYVAMEYSDAGTLREWLAERERSLPEILEAFVQAGRGLAAAHAAGLVHRDFKPDNVLVATNGHVRVTDFGLVGATGEPSMATPIPHADPLSQDLTRTGTVMGTPSYMAPEQFAGEPASAAADQFAFCVALYEACYGQRPFRADGPLDLAERVQSGQIEAPPAGTRVPDWLRRVVIRGLATDSARRYASMTDLLDELARDPARRRRIAVVIASGLAVAAAATAAVMMLRRDPGASCSGGAEQVAAAWNPAKRAAIERAFGRSSRPLASATVARLSPMLDDWSHGWQLAYTDACKSTRVRGTQSEQLLDLRMQCLNRRRDEAGATIDLLAAGGDDAVEHALDAATKLPRVAACADAAALTAAVAPPETEAVRNQVQAIRSQLDAARALDKLARYQHALALAQVAVASARSIGYPPIIAEALVTVAITQIDLADKTAIASAREAMLVAAGAGDWQTEIDAAGRLVFALARYSSRYDLALEISELADATAAYVHPRPESVVQLGNARGLLDTTRGRLADAQARCEKTLAFGEKALGADDPMVLATLNQLASTLSEEGKLADARAILERLVASDERRFGKDHPSVASALNNLGNVYIHLGKLDDAKRVYQRALAIWIAAVGPEHPDSAVAYNNLGTFYDAAGDPAQAIESFQHALAISEKMSGPDSAEVANALENLGDSLETLGKYDEARARLERAKHIIEAKGDDNPRLGDVISDLAIIDQRDHKLDEALAGYRRAEEIATKAYGPDHPVVIDSLGNEATVLASQKKYADAQDLDERVVTAMEKIYGPDHVRVGMALTNLSNFQGLREDYKGELDNGQKALAIFDAKLPKDHPYTSYALHYVGSALIGLSRPAEAVPYLERALAIRKKVGMPPELIAEALYALGRAHALMPATHARGVTEITAAIELWSHTKMAANAAEARTWLAQHR